MRGADNFGVRLQLRNRLSTDIGYSFGFIISQHSFSDRKQLFPRQGREQLFTRNRKQLFRQHRKYRKLIGYLSRHYNDSPREHPGHNCFIFNKCKHFCKACLDNSKQFNKQARRNNKARINHGTNHFSYHFFQKSTDKRQLAAVISQDL